MVYYHQKIVTFKYHYFQIVNMKWRERTEEARFFEEQLNQAKRALFSETSIRRIKFLQHRIQYLKKKIEELKE